MEKPSPMPKCFIIMPITTPQDKLDMYNGDAQHFTHVLDHLFRPALNNAGFDVIPPKSSGSDVIQAEIIRHLSSADLVLCDMSILNPNVFFEFGIRTALDRPVALVIDDKATGIPFDTSIINFHRYDSSLTAWTTETQIGDLAKHVRTAFDKSAGRSALWKYFGIAQTGEFKPGTGSVQDKIDLLLREVAHLTHTLRLNDSTRKLGETELRGLAHILEHPDDICSLAFFRALREWQRTHSSGQVRDTQQSP